MSDRRRYPPRNDWDDDLELAGFDRPQPQPRRDSSSRTQAPRQQPDQYDPYAYEDDPLAEPRQPQPRPSRSRQQPDDDLYGAAPDAYRAPVERAPRQSRSYPDDRYGAPRGDESGQYGYDPVDQPRSRSTAPRSRTSRQPYPPAQSGYDDSYAAAPYGEPAYGEAGYGDPEYAQPVAEAPAQRRRPSRTREPRQRPSVAVPMPAINDSAVIAIVAASLLSIVFMIASIAAGGSDLPEWIPIHLNASGNVDHWGTDTVLWRIPFGAFMAMIMALVMAAFLWKRDRFAARFAITGSAVVQVLAWVALIDFIW